MRSSVHEPARPSILSMDHATFAEAFAAAGHGSPDRAREVYANFYRCGVVHDAEVPQPTQVLTSDHAEGNVVKFTLPVPGVVGKGDDSKGGVLETESVVIPMRRKHETTNTLCVSSQVGCAMGCTFCETAQMGLIRSLTVEEIVAQWWAARHHLGHTIRNIVFMGMGEPLDNLDAVIGAIRVLTDHRGPSIGMRRVTISTVGRVDKLAELAAQIRTDGWRQLNLAVSINAPTDEIRNEIMPINRAMPLSDLIDVLADWPLRRSGRICVEYVLIPGVNDQAEHAYALCDLLKRVRCTVNVIPYNPRRDSPWPAPTEDAVWAFIGALESRGQFTKRRRTKGVDSMAACGQLGNERIRRRRYVGVSSSI